MKERGILFSAPMVRAILAGKKTQTRRVVKWPEWLPASQIEDYAVHAFNSGLGRCGLFEDGRAVKSFGCPYGQPGDRLWVRETFHSERQEQAGTGAVRWVYDTPKGYNIGALYRADAGSNAPWWRPSIFMPRCLSRITLEVTDIRVERLQDISEDDAKAEGIEQTTSVGPCRAMGWRGFSGAAPHMRAVPAYRDLWESINGEGSWGENPWVWVVGFRRLETKAEAA